MFDEIPLIEPPPMRTGIASILNVQGLRVRLRDIKSNSKMNIKFNNRVIMPSNFMQVFEQDKLRRLEDDQQPLIEVETEAGEGSDLEKLGLDWELSDVNDSGFGFKLKWKDPLYVSQNDTPDKLRVRFNLDQINDIYGQSLGNGTTILVNVPR